MVETNQESPLAKQTSPRGVFGIEISSGIYQEDYLSEIRGTQWAREADKMRTQDSQVKMCLGAILNPIRAASWDIISSDPTDEAQNTYRDFVHFILFEDMLRPWSVTLNEILTFITFGHSVFEIIHKNIKNHAKFGDYTGIKILAWRSPKTLEEWRLDKTTGELTGILQRATGDFTNDVVIPAQFLMVFTIDLEGNDFSGTTRSFLRPIYGNWKLKQFLKKLKAIGHEKMTIGTPKGTIPSTASPEDEKKFEDILSRYVAHQRGYIKVPEGYNVEVIQGKFDALGLEAGILAEDQEMVRAFLANFLNLGQGGTGGAYALGQDLSDFFLKGIKYISDIIIDVINTRLIPHIVSINFGEQENYPKMIVSGIEDVGKEFSEMMRNYIETGAVVVDQPLRSFIRKLHKLPPEIITVARRIIEPQEDDKEEDQKPEPNPKENEKDTKSDAHELTEGSCPEFQLAQSGRTLINQGSMGLKEVMALNLDFIGNKLVADIVNRFKNLPDSSKLKALDKIKPGGVNAYKKELRNALSNLAAKTINASRDLIGLGMMKFQDPLNITDQAREIYTKLPKYARDKVAIMVDLTVPANVADIEKAIDFQFNNSASTTLDPKIIEQDLIKAKTDAVTKIVSAAPVTAASDLVNSVSLDVYLSEEAQEEGVVAFEFFNEDPVSEICKHLSGRIFPVDDQESMRYAPPLHFNCKSTLLPIMANSPKANKLSKEGLAVTASGSNRDKIISSIQFSDCSRFIMLNSCICKGGIVQSVIFCKEHFNLNDAAGWLMDHGFSIGTQVETVDEYYVYRLEPRSNFIEESFYELPLSLGVKAVIGEPRAIPVPQEDAMFHQSKLHELQESTMIQTLIFDKSMFTRAQSLEWAKIHDFRTDKVDETQDSYRLRQRNPEDFSRGSFRTIDITNGIKAVIGRPLND